MSQLILKGKKKSDLAVIAQVAGLLTEKETKKMTKQELLDYLLSVEEKLTADGAAPESGAGQESKAAAKTAVESGGAKTSSKAAKTTAESMVAKDTTEESAEAATEKPPETEAAITATKRQRAGLTTRKTTARKTAGSSQRRSTALAPASGAAKAKPKIRRTRVSSADDQSADEGAKSVALEPVARQAETRLTVTDHNSTAAPDKLKADAADSNEESEQEKDSTRAVAEVEEKAAEIVGGVLEIMQDNYGFLRRENYLQGINDIYVPPQYIRRFGLRTGDYVVGPCRHQRDNDRYQALYYVKEVNGLPPDKMIRRPHFDRLTPIYPNERFVLETNRQELSTRIIDLVAPIGKGQRGMIVSPPKAGKTILLQKIAKAISANSPSTKLIVLLIDERPEEVTDMQRSIDGEVVYSTFDKTPENHVRVTELVLERAMRLVELKQDVVILLDSITRMGRAYNLTITPTGRTLSGGLDPGALYGPKRFFGAARNIENGGSLTIIATALIETGSRMDEVIFEEFKGTGNMEVLLDRKLSEKRIFPAIDITRSSTRREELLLSPKELDAVWGIRKAFGSLDTAAVTETIISLLLKTRNNDQFISSINISFDDKSLFDAMRGNLKTNSNNGK
ncbi:MAG: transcription termination factor Rho [Saccharofermentanales bacterium]|jgi:transcription termination factor Rho|nr:transcription termination factor Rho [Bacillota bacterium]